MRFGIIGTNFISDEFMKGVSLLSDKITVTGVCSGRIENAQAFADKYDIPSVFPNHIEMLDSGQIDAVYIATPNSKHYQMTLDALSRKIPTFCEKPLAVNLKQAEEMISLAIKNKTYLHHGIVPLYTPNLPVLKTHLAQLGPIRRVVLAMNQYSSRYDLYLAGENPTTFRKDLANGSLMDLGIYLISVLVALFGKPNRIQADSIMLDTGVDAASTLLLTYDSFQAVIMCSKVIASQVISEITGENGSIDIKLPSLLKDITLNRRKEQTSEIISQLYDNHFRLELEEFLNVVESGRYESDMVPYQLTLDIMEVLTEARLVSGIKFREDE